MIAEKFDALDDEGKAVIKILVTVGCYLSDPKGIEALYGLLLEYQADIARRRELSLVPPGLESDGFDRSV